MLSQIAAIFSIDLLFCRHADIIWLAAYPLFQIYWLHNEILALQSDYLNYKFYVKKGVFGEQNHILWQILNIVTFYDKFYPHIVKSANLLWLNSDKKPKYMICQKYIWENGVESYITVWAARGVARGVRWQPSRAA